MQWIAVFLVSLIGLTSCKDIIAKNITGATPEMISPKLNDSIAKSPVTFIWKELSGATTYQLQIASPSFSNMTYYVLDTMVSKTSFTIELDSNQYEYKLTALNTGYESVVLGPIRFWVGKSAVKTGSSSLVLSTPINNTFVNNTFNGRFTWLAVTNADNYEFELRKGGSFTTGTNVYTMEPGNTLDKTLPSNLLPLAPGEYTWRVLVNSGTTYLTQNTGKFTVDTLTPNQATLLTPTNNSTVTLSDSTNFTWNNGTQNALYQSALSSQIEISSDVNFNSILVTYTVNESQIKKIKLSSLTTGQTYYWRVKNKDAAGNASQPSTAFQFLSF
jgi:hypothetical protein